MVLRELGELPNRAGFKFIGVRHDCTLVNCFVFYDPERCIHRIGGEACYDDLMGWRNERD